jgi:hypothetical protein
MNASQRYISGLKKETCPAKSGLTVTLLVANYRRFKGIMFLYLQGSCLTLNINALQFFETLVTTWFFETLVTTWVRLASDHMCKF